MKYLPLIFLSLLFFSACKQKETKDRTYEINSLFPGDSLTASDSMRMDSMDLTTIKFEKEVYDFGEVTEGDVIKNKIAYKNTGKHPLVITNAQGSCGCTIASFDKEPIEPGKSGEIEVEFNSAGRPGAHTKAVYVQANTVPPTTIINFSVNVKEKKK